MKLGPLFQVTAYQMEHIIFYIFFTTIVIIVILKYTCVFDLSLSLSTRVLHECLSECEVAQIE